MEIIAVMVVIGLVACVIAYGLGVSFGGKSLVSGLSIFAVLAAFFGVGLAQATGYDGIGWAIVLFGGIAPAAAGYLIGGLLGWRLGKRDDAQSA